MPAFSEYRFYSPTVDAEVVRISMSDAQGGEYFMIIKAADGRRYRERRDEVIELIQQAIAQKLQPGEVRSA